jgi:hypothetical protein
MVEKNLDFEKIKNGYENYKLTGEISNLENILHSLIKENNSYLDITKKNDYYLTIDDKYYSALRKTTPQFFEYVKKEVEINASKNFGIVLNLTDYGFLYGLPFLGQKILIKKDNQKVVLSGYYESIPIMCCIVMNVLEMILKHEAK